MNTHALAHYVNRFSECTVAVVGDLMLDRYIWGRATRISQEAPVPVVCVTRETMVPGGAANVARNVLSLGAHAVVFGVVGADERGRCLCAELRHAGADVAGIVETPRPTTVKTRVLAGGQQVVRIDREDTAPIDEALASDIAARLGQALERGGIQAVIIEDYAKGLLTPGLVANVLGECRRHQIPVALDPHPGNLFKTRGLCLMTPNRQEAFALAGVYYESGRLPLSADRPLLDVGRRIMREWAPEQLLVTLGGDGMALFQIGKPPLHIPTKAREVFDVSGAGDTVMATFMLARVAGADPAAAAELSNYAAGIVVGKIGTAPISAEELLHDLS